MAKGFFKSGHLPSAPHLIVVGNGTAGMRTVEELEAQAPGRYRITVFGAEPHTNYNRIALSSVLAGDKSLDEIVINPRSWYEEHGIDLVTGDTVTKLDPAAKTVTAASGRVIHYDKLLLAVGSKPIAPPIVNERVHANIQKDGSYSVVPRMWGGITTPDELRAIADAADKHKIPTVKVTGGQRIDMLGARKNQLPAIWADLGKAGLVSGHAYGKALRTVKTCVGSEWCRFGTQDSTGLGVKIEKMCWGSYTPHKVKLAVSGCPRNCAEATIKDLGVVCVEAGYDIMVGGNGGVTVRVTDKLVRVATEEEVLEYVGAFMQLYREEAHYLERTAPWVERRGIDYLKRLLVDDDEMRRALHERFLYSQRFWQTDPWAERAAGTDAHEFAAMETVG